MRSNPMASTSSLLEPNKSLYAKHHRARLPNLVIPVVFYLKAPYFSTAVNLNDVLA